MVDGINALDGQAYVVRVAQVAGHGFHVGEGVQLVGAAGVAGVEEGADVVARFQEGLDQIGTDATCAAGYQNLHCETFRSRWSMNLIFLVRRR